MCVFLDDGHVSGGLKLCIHHPSSLNEMFRTLRIGVGGGPENYKRKVKVMEKEVVGIVYNYPPKFSNTLKNRELSKEKEWLTEGIRN